MSLEDLVKRVDPRKRDGHCPKCGEKGEETGRTEIRCPQSLDECEVLYWIPGEL